MPIPRPLLTHHGYVVAETSVPLGVFVGLAAVLMGVTLYGVARSWKVPSDRLPAVLRILARALLVAILLEPAWVEDALQATAPTVAVLVDETPSMGWPAHTPDTRAHRAQELLRELQNTARAKTPPWTLQVQRLQTRTETDLLAATGPLLAPDEAQHSATAPHALVLITDGADTAVPRGRDQHLAELSGMVALNAAGIPVSTALIAHPAAPIDVSLAHVQADRFAFIKNTMQIEADVEATGIPPDRPLSVTLSVDGQRVRTQPVQRDAQGRGHVTLAYTPDSVGERVFELAVTEVAQELTYENNRQRWVTRVVRDRIRVLHVAGRPSLDARFTREVLKADANLDLVSFYILRTPYSDNTVPESELSLIPFPVERLFTVELKNFDVVVLQNFDARPFGMETYLPHLARAIQGGLGLIVLGGAQSFGQAGLGGSALEPILPTLAGAETLEPGPTALTLAPQGAHHPVLDICPPGMARGPCLAGLPGLTDVNPLGALQPGAQVLATATLSGAPRPLVVAREVGRGRVLGVASDGLWHWRAALREPYAARAYERFWQQTLRWLSQDPAMAPLQVDVAQRELGPDEPLQVTITYAGPALPKDAARKVSVTLTPEDASAEAPVLDTQTATLMPSQPAALSLKGQPSGIYRVCAHLMDTPGVRAACTRVTVAPRGPEAQMLTPYPPLLKAMSQASGGAVIDTTPGRAGRFDRLPVRPPAPVVVGSRRVPLWDTAYALGALGLLLGAEVLLRRRAGLR